jgi:hypothetical protein
MNWRFLARRAFVFGSCWLMPFLCTQTAAPQTPPPDSGVKIQVNVNAILVPVVVRDGRGREVTDLEKKDFKVFDNNKAQAISGFTIQRRAAPGPGSPIQTSGLGVSSGVPQLNQSHQPSDSSFSYSMTCI